MKSIEERLNDRRTEILERLDNIGPGIIGTRGHAEKPLLIQEVLTIEQLLTQISATAAQERQTDVRVAEQVERDNYEFWLRRWMTWVSVGNGGAFLAIMTGIIQSDAPNVAASLAKFPAYCFGFGLMLAAVVPAGMIANGSAKEDNRHYWGIISRILAMFAAMAFISGVYASLSSVRSAARPKSFPAAQISLTKKVPAASNNPTANPDGTSAPQIKSYPKKQ